MQLILRIRRFYWWLARPKTHGVRGIVLNDKNEILLVRHRYDRGWFLPGGGVNRNEAATDALIREVSQETGLFDLKIEYQLGTYASEQEYKRDTIDVFVIRASGTLASRLDVEIQEAKFFLFSAIPKDTSPATYRRIAEYRKESPVHSQW